MDFDSWWNDHGKHNAAAKGGADKGVRELMKLAFEVGSEGRQAAVAAERERLAVWMLGVSKALDKDGDRPGSIAAHVMARAVQRNRL